jgi:hypothetical protein
MNHDAQPIDWGTFSAEILELYKPSMRAPATATAMRLALASLPPLGVQTTADLDIGLIARFVDGQPSGLSPSTVRSRLRVLRTIANYACKLGYLKLSPFSVRPMGQWVRAAPSKRKQFHSRQDIGRVLAEMARQVETTSEWRQWRARRLLCLTSTLAHTRVPPRLLLKYPLRPHATSVSRVKVLVL